MAAVVPLSVAQSLGFDLAAAVRAFFQQIEAHALTVDVPAPTAHPLVEQIVQFHAGEFVIEDDTPPEPEVPVAFKRAAAAQLIDAGLHQHLATICSLARRALAQMDQSEILMKPDSDRTQAERNRLAEIALVEARSRVIQRHATLLQIELEDLPEDQIDGWKPHSWPAP